MTSGKGKFSTILVVFLLCYAAIAARLFYFQVVHAKPLTEAGKEQSADALSIEAIRGEIMTSDGYPIAANSLSYLLYANPKLIESKEKFSRLLAPVLDTKEASLEAKIDNDLFWVELAEGIDISTKKEIQKLNINGLGFQLLSDRYYPEGSMAAHVVGFVGKNDEGGNVGYFGIEGYYNKQLEGRDGKLYAIKDALGNPVLSDIRREKELDGRDITLSIDRTIQFYAENRLKKGLEAYEAEGGSVIVMNPKTGKVLAMASFPQFDPQNYSEYPASTYKNPVISNVYEPGSTFKVLVMAAALDAGVVSHDTECTNCDGPVRIGQYDIKTWNDKYHPHTSMTDVIVNSDNTGMVFVARLLGRDRMLNYFDKFGLNSVTGIDLQGEISGSIRPKEQWHEIGLATASFGQGISITPMQLITAVSSIANDGVMMYPQLVDKIETGSGDVIKIEPQKKGRTVSEKAAKEMTMMMVEAVKRGDSRWVQLDGYTVAGKTGTAQIPVAGHYDPNQTIASFVGFFPAYDPQISILVLVNRPKTSIYGSETAAPIFFEIAKDITNYKQLVSD